MLSLDLPPRTTESGYALRKSECPTGGLASSMAMLCNIDVANNYATIRSLDAWLEQKMEWTKVPVERQCSAMLRYLEKLPVWAIRGDLGMREEPQLVHQER